MTEEQIDYIESENFIEGHECIRHAVPWITKEAIYKLDYELEWQDVVMEVGTGGSTIFFSDNCKSVIAIETNPEWYDQVKVKLHQNVLYFFNPDEAELCDIISAIDSDDVTVFSVDTQGGYNRERILYSFLDKGVSENLRMIILDNYGHEGLFPNIHNKILELGEGWECLDFNHPRWAGNGTRIYIKK